MSPETSTTNLTATAHRGLLTALKRNSREWLVALVFLVILVFLAFTAPSFFRKSQLLPMLTAAAPLLLVSCGVSLIIICRQIDISIGSQFAMCSVFLGLLVQAHLPVIVAGVVVVGAGAVLGAFNGLMVSALRLPSIVVTLATMVTCREALRWWRQGEFVRDLPESFQWLGIGQGRGQAAILAGTALIFLLLVFALKHLSGGRFIYAVGSDAEAARLAGIRPQLVTMAVFVFMGALTGLASVLNAIRFSDIDPKTGTGLELQAIAAAVVGGVAISGGRGKLWGVLAGVLLLASIAPALVFLHLPPQWERALQGLIILAAVVGEVKRR